jgi:hypothetical protein
MSDNENRKNQRKQTIQNNRNLDRTNKDDDYQLSRKIKQEIKNKKEHLQDEDEDDDNWEYWKEYYK